jgi:recombination protein RecR
MASQEIDNWRRYSRVFPGWPRSARRAVLWLIKRRDTALGQLRDALEVLQDRLVECTTCGNVDTTNPCAIAPIRAGMRSICVVEDVADLWALDRARLFTGRYHVLGGRLSALDGVRPRICRSRPD